MGRLIKRALQWLAYFATALPQRKCGGALERHRSPSSRRANPKWLALAAPRKIVHYERRGFNFQSNVLIMGMQATGRPTTLPLVRGLRLAFMLHRAGVATPAHRGISI